MPSSGEMKVDDSESNFSSNKKNDFNIHAQQLRLKKAVATSGIGKAKEKGINLELFWEQIWPKLEEAGWTKYDGVGAQLGSIKFLPKGSVVETGGIVIGEHYDRIRDVLDRLEKDRSQTEAAIFKLYHSQQGSGDEKSPLPDRAKRPSAVTMVPKVDLSWKEGGKVFPRKSSRVGDAYQVPEIPKAGTFEADGNSECVLLWDPKEASSLYDENGILAIIEQVPQNKRELALALLVQRNYLPGDDFVKKITASPAQDGSDWSDKEKARFSECVFIHRKDLHRVRAAMEIDMATCLAHYYGTFKHTDGYLLVKTVLQDEKLDTKIAASTGHKNAPAAGEPDACLVCDDGGELLICDGCEGEYHMECMDPALKSVPEGLWECDECVNQKLLVFRDFLVRQSGLFEVRQGGNDGEGHVVFKPTPSAQACVRKMAAGISRLLASVEGEEDNDEDEENNDEKLHTPKGKAASIKQKSCSPCTSERAKRKRSSEAEDGNEEDEVDIKEDNICASDGRRSSARKRRNRTPKQLKQNNETPERLGDVVSGEL